MNSVEGGGEAFPLPHLFVERGLAEEVGLFLLWMVGEVRHTETGESYRAPCVGWPFAVKELQHEVAEGDVVARRAFKTGLAGEGVEQAVT